MSFIKVIIKFRKQWTLIKGRISAELEYKDSQTLSQTCFLPSGKYHFLREQITEGLLHTVFNSITMQLTALTVTQVYLEKTMNILIHWITID